MKGSLTLKLLEILEKTVYNISSLGEAMMSGYSSSYQKLRRLQPSQQTPFTDELRQYLKDKHKLETLISRLKKDNLIETKLKNNKRYLAITIKGKKKLLELKKREDCSLPDPLYKSQNSPELKIIIFDIPERERKKRDWLREVLKFLDFKMIQKSVWLGKSKIPKELIEDFQKYNLMDYIEIFAITKQGSLRKFK